MFELAQMTNQFEQWWHRQQSPAVISPAVNTDPRADWLPQKWCQQHSRFLDQQFWCFGQDIVQQPRNALIELGFSKRHSATPRKREESSCYTVTSRTGVSLALWGFGMFYSDRRLGGAILLVRDSIRPLMVEQLQLPLGAWAPFEIPTHEARESEVPLASQLLTDLLLWLSQYETWIGQHRSAGHRERSLGEWKRVVVPASEMSVQWSQLSSEVHAWKPLDRETA